MKIKQRLKNLESVFKAVEDARRPVEKISPGKRQSRLVELTYKLGEYKGYKFLSPEQYAALDEKNKRQYFENEMMERMREWADEYKNQNQQA